MYLNKQQRRLLTGVRRWRNIRLAIWSFFNEFEMGDGLREIIDMGGKKSTCDYCHVNILKQK